MTDIEARTEPALVAKLRARKESHRRRHPLYRALFVLAGATCLLAGAAMVVLPGPAFVVIPIGLALLALEYEWAETLLGRSLREAEKARRRAADSTPLQRALSGVVLALGVAAFAAAALRWDIPLLPV